MNSHEAISIASADLYDEINPIFLVKEFEKTVQLKNDLIQFIAANHNKPFY